MEHRRSWKLPALFVVAALVSVGAAIAVARAAATPSHLSHHSGAQRTDASTGNPAQARAMQVLEVEHAQDMRAWRDKFAADTTGVEATKALQRLHRVHHQEMIAAFTRLGIKPSVQSCAATGSMMDGATGGMMGDSSVRGMMNGSSASGMMGRASGGGAHAQHHGSGNVTAGACGSSDNTMHRVMMGIVTP